VEDKVEALLITLDEDTPVKFRPCDNSNEIVFKLEEACGFDGSPNVCLRQLPRRFLVHLPRLFDHILRLGNVSALRKDAKLIILSKPDKDPKHP
jgi:hypothetical protein